MSSTTRSTAFGHVRKMTNRMVCILSALLIVLSSSFSQHPAVARAEEPIALIEAPFPMLQLLRPVFPDKDFDIRSFGAVEGGQVKNTTAIWKAIEAAAKSGGGRVVVPPGKWLTGAIQLEDNINLYLSKGAELQFSQEYEDYLPVVFSRHEDTECYKYSSFIYANRKTNIAITGEGTLNGQGKPWWGFKESKKDVEVRLKAMADSGVPVEKRIFDGTNGDILRPAFFQPMNCRNVLVEGVTFLYGAFWTITPTYCENVIVRRVRIVTEGDYGHTPNGDGVDLSSCKNVLIEYCEFDTGDDCIAIKSGRDRDGLRVGIPTEDVVIRHCVGLRGHGGVVIGSETSGGIRNIYAFDCRFAGTDRIVRIKTARGRGGIIENMWFRNMSADTIEREAIHLNMLYTGTRFPSEPLSAATPRIRNIHFAGISCVHGKTYAIEMLGLPEMPIENVTFDSISIGAAKGIACTDVEDIRITNTAVKPGRWPVVEIIDGERIVLDGITFPAGADPFVRVSGGKTDGVRVMNTKTATARKAITIGPGASMEAVRIEE